MQTKVQEMLTYPQLDTTLVLDVSRLWRLYLNICMAASSSEVMGDTGTMVPFSLEPIPLDL